MNAVDDLYSTTFMGLLVLSMAASFAGAWVCLAYRRLSGWLIAAAVAFSGEFLGLGLGFVILLAAKLDAAKLAVLSMGAGFLGLASTIVLVFGLGLALADIRRKLAVAMEPDHARR